MQKKFSLVLRVLLRLLLVLSLGGLTRPITVLASSAQNGFIDCSYQYDIPEAECQALVMLFNTTHGSSWVDHYGWLELDTPCSWSGVTCTNRHVTKLSFYHNSMSGWLPAEIGNLSKLRVLDFYHDDLSGPIPPELGKLHHLERLGLGGNELSGELPVELGDLTDLMTVDLFGNQLTGQLPVEIAGLTQLKFLSLSGNDLEGSIPAGFGNLVNLTYLSLGDNHLGGGIPSELGNLGQLQTLILSGNQLTGHVPPELGQLTLLNNLMLDQNLLIGGVPLTFTSLTAVWAFHFNHTGLCEPTDHAFQNWKAHVTDWGSTGETCLAITGWVKINDEGIPWVTISAEGGRSTITGADGVFTLGGLSSGSYMITPVKNGYAFQPPFVKVTLPTNTLSIRFEATKVEPLYQLFYLPFLSR